MGNSCFGLKEKLLQLLRPQPTLLIMPQRKPNDLCIVILGSPDVGKSSLVKRWVSGYFREKYVPTMEDTYQDVLAALSA